MSTNLIGIKYLCSCCSVLYYLSPFPLPTQAPELSNKNLSNSNSFYLNKQHPKALNIKLLLMMMIYVTDLNSNTPIYSFLCI